MSVRVLSGISRAVRPYPERGPGGGRAQRRRPARMVVRAALGSRPLALALCALAGLLAATPAGSAAQPITVCQNSMDANELHYRASGKCADPREALRWNKQGVRGPIGPAGSSGATGATGATGPEGATEDPGATGPTGATGVTGGQGPPGSPGKPGPVIVFLEKTSELLKNLAASLLALIAAFYLLMVIAVNLLVRVPCMKRWRATRWLMRRVMRASLSIEMLDDAALDDRVGPAVTGLVRSRCRYPRGRLGLDNIGGQAAVKNTMSAFKDLAGTNTTFALIGYLYALWPRQRFVLSGELQPHGPLGPGISLALNGKGVRDSVVTLWAGEYGIDVKRDTAGTTTPAGTKTATAGQGKTPSESEMEAYGRLATVAGAWVDHRLMTALGEPPLSRDWRSWMLLRAGLDHHRLGEHGQARELYEQALAHDGKNAGALANLGILERRKAAYKWGAEDPSNTGFDRAKKLLCNAAERLKELDDGQNDQDLYRVEYHLSALYQVKAELTETSEDICDAVRQARKLRDTANKALKDRKGSRASFAKLRRVLAKLCCGTRDTRGHATADWDEEDFLLTAIVPSAEILYAGALWQAMRAGMFGDQDKMVRRREIAEVIKRAIARETELAPRAFYNLACLYAHTKQITKAEKWLETAIVRTAIIDRKELLCVIKEDPALKKCVENASFMQTLREYLPFRDRYDRKGYPI